MASSNFGVDFIIASTPFPPQTSGLEGVGRIAPILSPAEKREWLNRLRGGGYEQITGRWTDHAAGRCVLGVLRDVLTASDPIGHQKLNFPGALGFTDGRANQDVLVGMNDMLHWDFCRLASWIDHNVPCAEAVPARKTDAQLVEELKSKIFSAAGSTDLVKMEVA